MSSGQPEVRNIQITGGAVDHYRKERAGGTRKRRVHKGGDVPPGAPITAAANFVAARGIQAGLASGGSHVVTKIAVAAPPVQHKAPASASAPAPPLQKPEPTVAKVSKLTLTPPKKTPKKILLAPPGAEKKGKVGKSVKTRKIRVQLSGLNKRITKARHISRSSVEKPIAEVRKTREDAKLIKPLSGGGETVPEAMLRGIYKDYLLLRNRAL